MNPIESILSLSPFAFRESLVRGLAGPGYAIFPDLIRPEVTREVRTEMETLRDGGAFRPAAIGKGPGTQHVPETRGDGTYWFESDGLTPVQEKLASLFDFVRESLNAELYLGLWDWEGHYAIYPPGTFYRKHLDRFRNDSKRTVSVVLFLNSDWKKESGGALRLDTGAGENEILPASGTAVFFLSEKIPHEVLETNRERLSFAGWFRTRV